MLCRIYKKGNTQRSHERDDSMDDMIGEVPPSINVGHMSARFHLSKMSTSYSGALLENDRNTLEGVVMPYHHHHLIISLPPQTPRQSFFLLPLQTTTLLIQPPKEHSHHSIGMLMMIMMMMITNTSIWTVMGM